MILELTSFPENRGSFSCHYGSLLVAAKETDTRTPYAFVMSRGRTLLILVEVKGHLRSLEGHRPASAPARRNSNSRGHRKVSEVVYKVSVTTGNKKNAGTDAHVYIQLRGSKGKMPKKKLTKKSTKTQSGFVKVKFSRNTTKSFKLKSAELGDLQSLIVEYDGLKKRHSYFLESIAVVTNLSTKQTRTFPCNQWLSLFESDCQLSRTLDAVDNKKYGKTGYKYIIHVFTGKKRGAGTDANVSITIFGEGGDSGERRLKSSKNNFERGQEDQFAIESYPLGPLKKIRVGHDNSMVGAGWFLDKVIIDDVEMNATYELPCNRWLAKDEDDGLITRELYCGKNAGSEDSSSHWANGSSPADILVSLNLFERCRPY
ncbi:Lipoxygenase-likey domain-containing protein 1 [Holothuria leucospilota]|uniref:Lipoxygenase-likey domain-containing protein 1 n=1 Tax=Holothuria leucospilota TaxID=206669 RepID=A0A9Q1CQV6_HOLLE|nr:Lipoxygenase-likey domain-containing protein 1 [Holothuria leucospilota]